MAGYQTSDEMSGVAGKVTGEAGPIGDEAELISTSHVVASDAGRDFADKGTAYLNAIQHNVVAGVRAFATVTTTVGDRLTDTYQRYSQTEDRSAGTLRSSGAGA